MINRIKKSISHTISKNEVPLASFLTVGYPSIKLFPDILDGVIEGGSDIIELGIPFSDPLAEGPTIQKTSNQALRNGINLEKVLSIAEQTRKSYPNIPIVLMGYINPFLKYGLENLIPILNTIDIDGLIIPDLPFEESGAINNLIDSSNISLIPLISPTSTDKRIEQSAKSANSFIYCVSISGVTGARSNIPEYLPKLVHRIRSSTNTYVLVGFGISNKKQINKIKTFADGVVVGSALLDCISQSSPSKAASNAKKFIQDLKSKEK